LGVEKIPVPQKRRKWKNYIQVIGARENNLKNLHVKFPLGTLTVVTGVSGSGKTSLVKHTLFNSLKKKLSGYVDHTGTHESISGDLHKIFSVEMVDQNPIGKSSRSNPVTYIKAYDEIRILFASQPLAKLRGYKPSTFSFNIDGGRCEICDGEGEITIEMQFMADVHLECEACKGKRFKKEVLEIEYKEKNISDVLNMTVDEAIEYFNPDTVSGKGNESIIPITNGISRKLKLLQDVGMGYVKLGQSSSTLSGGEAQRVKLATFLNTQSSAQAEAAAGTLFIFDEPTTGLHFHDIKKLLHALNRLVDEGNTVVIIEHNLDVIKCADWVIDLGPEGGNEGGNLMFAGTPEELIKNTTSITGRFLKRKI
jgi:excinuclease ABC subunit A